MADFDFRKDSSDERVLMVAFTEGSPLEAREVAAVLRALDGDYRDLTGRGLVLGRMETGSTYMWVYDALAAVGAVATSVAEIAKAVEDITVFGAKLKDAFKPKKTVLPQTEMREVARTVKEIAKVAKKKNTEILFRKAVVTDQGSETIDIQVTPMEAISARQRLDRVAEFKAVPVVRPESAMILEEMRRLPRATSDTELVITTLVRALSYSGSTSALAQVADILAGEGRMDLAEIIWRHTGRGQGRVTITE